MVARHVAKWLDSPALLLACGLASAGFGCGERCLTYDYSPPSARFHLVDAATGEALCDAALPVTSERGRPIPLEDLCEWRLPEWMTEEAIESGATSSDVRLSLAGYAEQTLTVVVVRNGCGEIQPPDLVEVALEPE